MRLLLLFVQSDVSQINKAICQSAEPGTMLIRVSGGKIIVLVCEAECRWGDGAVFTTMNLIYVRPLVYTNTCDLREAVFPPQCLQLSVLTFITFLAVGGGARFGCAV